MSMELGRSLVHKRDLTDEVLRDALVRAGNRHSNLLEVLLSENKYSEEEVADSFAQKLRLPRVNLAATVSEPDAIAAIAEETAQRYLAVPIKLEGRSLVVAMANPTDVEAHRDIEFATGKALKILVATRTEILDALKKIYAPADALKEFLENIRDVANFQVVAEEKTPEQLDFKDAELPPVVKMVNLVIHDSIRARASDIHLEPTVNELMVRVRVDGVMREFMQLPKWVIQPVVSRIKILSKLDIAERRIPQDGRLKVLLEGRERDLRVSTLPTHIGEKVVMRVLGSGQAPEIAQLGFVQEDLDLVLKVVQNPQGMVLVTGPTGSGKSTTLYSVLNFRKSPEVNIITVEDPVEYQLPGLNQVQINPKTGLTFAAALRSCLRQDPDVILVGEIRDHETAEVAFHAAMTGHMVLSTLHTNNGPATIARLLDLGIDPFVVSSSVLLVIAQRLARKVCQNCRTTYTPDETVLKRLALTREGAYYRGTGCAACNATGFSGRTGIYELLQINLPVREAINKRAPETDIRRAAIRAGGYTTLLQKGLAKVQAGITSPDELLRVLQIEDDDVATCPGCLSHIDPDFTTCPYCSYSLKNICQGCRQELRPKWKICPYCGTPVAQSKAEAEGRMLPWPSAPTPPPLDQASAHAVVVGLATQGPDRSTPAAGVAPANPERSPSVGTQQAVAAVAAPNLERSAPVAGRRVKVLVVDDDPSIQTVLRKTLNQLPHPIDVDTANNGREALGKVEEFMPDLVLLDIMMPEVDGFTVCQKLRENVRTAFIPIIMLTANPGEESRTKGYLVGTDDYMNKPFSVPDLLARISRLLRRTYGI